MPPANTKTKDDKDEIMISSSTSNLHRFWGTNISTQNLNVRIEAIIQNSGEKFVPNSTNYELNEHTWNWLQIGISVRKQTAARPTSEPFNELMMFASPSTKFLRKMGPVLIDIGFFMVEHFLCIPFVLKMSFALYEEFCYSWWVLIYLMNFAIYNEFYYIWWVLLYIN